MGYQESYVKVESLAEAAGIRRAIREHEGHEWFDYVCCERARREVSFGDGFTWWGYGAPRVMPAGTLVVVVSGGRHPYQMCGGRWEPIDAAGCLNRENYYDYFSLVNEELVDAAVDDNREETGRAYEAWSRYLDTIWDEPAHYGDDFYEEVHYGRRERAVA